ncbi:MAG: hypothetical protein ACI91O_001640 [Candidatus Poriferisodalaceae bacterium]|jgi:hypothetical protein
MDSSPRVGLVSGAGGESGGAFIRAALQEIETRTGWHPTAAATIVGTSIGALISARIEPDAQQTTQEMFAGLNALAAAVTTPARQLADVAILPSRRLAGRAIALAAPSGKHRADYPTGRAPT